jgi:predicted HicB family RNase H-like nuclease
MKLNESEKQTTNVVLTKELHWALKRLALDRQTSLGELVRQFLREGLNKAMRESPAKR